MDMWKMSLFWRSYPSSQKTRTYWTIIIFSWLDVIYRESFCIWVTLVGSILCISESYIDHEERIAPTFRSLSSNWGITDHTTLEILQLLLRWAWWGHTDYNYVMEKVQDSVQTLWIMAFIEALASTKFTIHYPQGLDTPEDPSPI